MAKNENSRNDNSRPRNEVTVHIERLILDGFDLGPGQTRLVRAAVETELSALLQDGEVSGHLRSGGNIPSLPAPAMQMNQQENPTRIGQQIAHAVYGGIGESR